MDELYQAIEEKIKAAGYPREISGQAVYEDICDQIEGKENGSYVLLSKFEDDVIFEYHITIMDHEFNLGILTMRLPEGIYAANFDEDLYIGSGENLLFLYAGYCKYYSYIQTFHIFVKNHRKTFCNFVKKTGYTFCDFVIQYYQIMKSV